MKILLFTDGAFSRSSLRGGNAYVVQAIDPSGEIVKQSEYSETVENTTSNRMELQAIINGLKFLKPCCVEIISDSTYCVDTINKWITSFIKDPNRLNLDLMLSLYEQIKRHKKVKATWVRGHADNHMHNYVNDLAQKAAGTYKEKKSGRTKNTKKDV